MSNKNEFNVGDKVFIVHDTDFARAGEIGFIHQMYEDTVRVIFRGYLGVNLYWNEIEKCKK